jgi:AcrR family transcriptional regulator
MPTAVPPKRTYQSELRQQQAQQTREKVIAAAAELFGELGYAGTTLAKIAERAGVAVETVQKIGPKSALMRAAVEYTSFGIEGNHSVFELDAGQQLLALGRAAEVPALAAATMRAVNSRSAGTWVALTCAAHGDAELRATFVQFLTDIRQQSEQMLAVLLGRGWLRKDISFEDAVDRWTVLTSVETYVRLRASRRSDDEYALWLERMLAEALIEA